MEHLAAARTYDLKLDEDEFTELANLYSELAEIANDKMSQYLRILDEILTDAVVSGDLHDKLELFKEKAVKIYQNTFGDSCSEMSSKLNEFVIAVDERDGDMYGYGQYVAY